MATFEQMIEVAASPDEAYRYVADFTTVTEWDPGMAESRLVGGEAGSAGAVYDVVALFRGSRVPFRYRIAEAEPGRRLRFEGEGAKARSTDEIVFAPAGDGTRLTYRAELTMKGIYRLAEPFLGGTFDAMGRKAMAGLKTRLDSRS
jgi:carbon monoxide dehydrogenase subunit G